MRLLLIFLLSTGLFARPRICLNMIVKNESRVIERCLRSAKPIIDYWVIADTGSTDDTKKIIKRVMKGIPGQLVEHKWQDFAHNRNLALLEVPQEYDYVLFIDADEVFEYLPDFSWGELGADSYLISVVNARGSTPLSRYDRKLLIKRDLQWKWVGVLHEYLESPQEKKQSRLHHIHNISRTEEGYRYQDPLKFIHDAHILEEALKNEPDNARYVFYAARSYFNAERFDKALTYFKKRIEMNGSSSELFTSFYCMGECLMELGGSHIEIIQAYTAAHITEKTRKEPFYSIAEAFLRQGQPYMAYLVLEKALNLPKTTPSTGCQVIWMEDWGLEFKMAESLYKLNQLDAAKELIVQLLKNPRMPEIYKKFLKTKL